MKDFSYSEFIDHTTLKFNTTKSTIERFCQEASKYKFKSVCISSGFVSLASELLKATEVKVCTVVGFPLGSNSTEVKVFEAKNAIENGAHEIDMVMNIGALLESDYNYVLNDIQAVAKVCKEKVILKVIIESSELTNEQIIKATELVVESGADFIKTSTGFNGGATIEDVKLIKSVCGDKLKIKASTGINNRLDCDVFLNLGVVRFGTSKGIKIVEGQ